MNSKIALPNNFFPVAATSEIFSLSNPLKDLLSIDGFCYHKIFLDQKEIILANNPDWVKHMYEYNLTIKEEYMNYVGNTKESHFKVTLWPFDNKIRLVNDAKEICHWYYGITLSKGNEHFGFSIKNEKNITALNTLLNQRELLERFCLFFTEQAASIIQKASNCPKLYSSSLSLNVAETRGESLSKNAQNFIEQTPLHLYAAGSLQSKITAKEIQCLKLLAQGHTAAETAALLKISKRTVETHLESLKFKTHADSKNNLIKLVFKNNWLPYL